MRLAEFIERNRDRIVDAWQQFAEMLPPFGARASSLVLREHAGHMLDAVVADLRSPLPSLRAAVPVGCDEARGSGGSEHGLQRHAAGLSLVALISEFRALRAVVLRLWAGAGFVRSPAAFDDLQTFNESLDRITAEAVLAFAQAAERDRALVTGIVAHDLRGPLQTASMAAHILAQRHPAVGEDETLAQLKRSLARMAPMVDDLMSVAASGLRGAMNVRPVRMDLTALAAEIVAEVAAEFPSHRFVLDASGPHVGNWDRARLGQLASNLLRNAAVHGEASGVVRIALREGQGRVVLSVHNRGPVIAEAERANLFLPAARGATAKAGLHLGLGLFIVREIAHGHGGSVGVSSDVERGTVFSVVLPTDAAMPASSAPVGADSPGDSGPSAGAAGNGGGSTGTAQGPARQPEVER